MKVIERHIMNYPHIIAGVALVLLFLVTLII